MMLYSNHSVAHDSIIINKNHRITNQYFDSKINILRNITQQELETYQYLDNWIKNGSTIYVKKCIVILDTKLL